MQLLELPIGTFVNLIITNSASGPSYISMQRIASPLSDTLPIRAWIGSCICISVDVLQLNWLKVPTLNGAMIFIDSKVCITDPVVLRITSNLGGI